MTDPDGYPEPNDAKAWNDAAVAASVGQLTRIRDLAGKWSATVTALIGVFGSIAVFTGTTALKDVPNQIVRIVLVAMTAAAAVCAAVSIYFGAKAAYGGDPVAHTNFNGETLRNLVANETPGAISNMRAARGWGLTAAAFVAVLSVAALSFTLIPKDAAKASFAVVTADGLIYCGPTDFTDNKLTAVGSVELATLGDLAEIYPVESC